MGKVLELHPRNMSQRQRYIHITRNVKMPDHVYQFIRKNQTTAARTFTYNFNMMCKGKLPMDLKLIETMRDNVVAEMNKIVENMMKGEVNGSSQDNKPEPA